MPRSGLWKSRIFLAFAAFGTTVAVAVVTVLSSFFAETCGVDGCETGQMRITHAQASLNFALVTIPVIAAGALAVWKRTYWPLVVVGLAVVAAALFLPSIEASPAPPP